MIVIVPNELRDKLYQVIDAQIEKYPKLITERECLYNNCLAYFDEHGTIPQINVTQKEQP